ncbi:MAG: DUF1552 domain-containing protein [Myxococcota bacterium]
MNRTLLRGVAKADGEFPKRLVIFWNPQGNCSALDNDYAPNQVEPFWPEGNERDFDLRYDPASPSAGRILAPLAPHKDDLLIMRGFSQENTVRSVSDYCDFMVSDGNHGTGTRDILTATCPFINGEGRQFGGGPSIDQYIASALGGETPRDSMVLTCGGARGGHRGFISYSAANTPIAPMSPSAAYLNAFGSSIDGDERRLLALQDRRASALDLIRSDAARLRARLPRSQREQFDVHLEAIRTIERDLGRTQVCDGGDAPPDDRNYFPGHFQQQARIVAASIACDISRIFTVMAASGGGDSAADLRFFDPTWEMNYHSTGHANGGTVADSNVTGTPQERRQSIEVMVRVSEFYAQWIADLITELKAIPEGEGSVFDNTILVWCTEMSNGNHGFEQWPWVVAGGGWKFNSGYYWNEITPKYSRDQRSGDILTAVAQGMGVDTQQFGSDFHSGIAPERYAHLWSPNV